MDSTGQLNSPPLSPRLRRLGLAILMVLGSLAIWLGSPFFWLWLTSKLQSGTQATMGPYGLMIVGLILSSVLIGKGLGILNRRYAAIDPNNGQVRIHLPWHRMLGGEHEVRSVPVTILDVIMVISVMVAVLLLVVWFFVVQPTPPGLQPGPAKH